MDSGLIINLIMAGIAIVFFIRFVVSSKRHQEVMEKHEELSRVENKERREKEIKYQGEIYALKKSLGLDPVLVEDENRQAITALTAQIDDLHKEKNQELQLRLEAEKQIALAINKAQDMQRNIDSWKEIQEESLKDTTNIVSKISNNLYGKLAIHHSSQNKILVSKIGESIQNIYLRLDDITHEIKFLSKNSIEDQNNIIKTTGLSNVNQDLEVILKSFPESKINYFLQNSIPEEFKKYVPCDAFIIWNKKNSFIIDTKLSKFFLDFSKNKHQKDAKDILKQNIDKYLIYITNPKYRLNIVNYFLGKKVISQEVQVSLIILLPSEKELMKFSNLGNDYLEKLQNNNIKIQSLTNFNKIMAV